MDSKQGGQVTAPQDQVRAWPALGLGTAVSGGTTYPNWHFQSEVRCPKEPHASHPT